ncbi:ribosome production factor 2 homolog [Triticum aestivum]|uniref:ribosome production factor 2 homolog n=1 Tax=Triticum aestivum TaxID=4565 RepID=UPI001D0108AC|nr:ribosome production factor 2 homolog [Triticum aestivum]
MRAPGHANKVKNVTNHVIDGKRGMIYIADQKISKLTLTSDIKGLKRVRRDARKNKGRSKKQKLRKKKKKKLAHKNAK